VTAQKKIYHARLRNSFGPAIAVSSLCSTESREEGKRDFSAIALKVLIVRDLEQKTGSFGVDFYQQKTPRDANDGRIFRIRSVRTVGRRLLEKKSRADLLTKARERCDKGQIKSLRGYIHRVDAEAERRPTIDGQAKSRRSSLS